MKRVFMNSEINDNQIISTTCGKKFDLRNTEKIIEKSNSLFSYNIHKLKSGEYIIAEKFYANPYNNRYILLTDEQIEALKIS
ncbi:hypothetical protein AAE02nite_51010 [Adhaeribacter aerolatus]|uniref:Uncharacterized protein n=1 Tax=Adhaeribacter aerolatus TaxID=670289 RepID=A0A512B6N3_9BACT|nr:hypothetical protein [Adhaeribacter aerolatus]GEO07437.1 hypothetical protein AAE02nite_51010 [Adhaeribacter aerolatus]